MLSKGHVMPHAALLGSACFIHSFIASQALLKDFCKDKGC